MPDATPTRRRLLAATLIVVASALLGVLTDWRAPGLSRGANDWLMRERGSLPTPQDIVIAAIDEKSISEFGRFPWPRSVLARTIEALRVAEPKVIAVDVLFADPTFRDEDGALARSIERAGNVVLAGQLADSPVHGGPSGWLLPIPALASAAAGIGHVNVLVEIEGVARQIAVQAADDNGRSLRSIAVEAVRVADRAPAQGVSFTGRALVVGERAIPLDRETPAVLIGQSGDRAPVRLETGRMTIDYIGPAGSFGAVTYSIADILRGTVPGSAFRGKYVLIGATAASQSDRVASPFLHRIDARADEHGVLMPGVEVLANALSTILHARFYSETSGWTAFFLAAAIAALMLFLLDRSEGRLEVVRQTGALAILAAVVVLLAYLEFTRLLILPPLVACLVALAASAMMGLFRRSFSASAQLDASIADLSRSSEILAAPARKFEPRKTAWLPHGLEWKAEQVRELNGRLVERSSFVDLALRSVEDGLIIATPDGAITFVNRGAGAILNSTPRTLAGQNLFERLGLADDGLLGRLVGDRARVEREIEMRDTRPRRYILRMAAVPAEPGSGPVIGIVASLSDVTRQHELQQTKNDVIALVSHEMRTPLTAIQGMTELLATYEMEAERRKEISAAINDEVKRLTGMITEYLDITRLESGATEIRKKPLKLDSLLPRIVLLLQPVAGRNGIRLTLDADRTVPAVVADGDLLGRAVENLVSNAIKYSPAGTEVVVRTARDGDSIAISVTDQGYGIAEDDLARVFEKFYRVPRVEDVGVPGTGLGLALVREIAELHGGTITVTSKINAGSTFILRIPRTNGEAPNSTLEG